MDFSSAFRDNSELGVHRSSARKCRIKHERGANTVFIGTYRCLLSIVGTDPATVPEARARLFPAPAHAVPQGWQRDEPRQVFAALLLRRTPQDRQGSALTQWALFGAFMAGRSRVGKANGIQGGVEPPHSIRRPGVRRLDGALDTVARPVVCWLQERTRPIRETSGAKSNPQGKREIRRRMKVD